MKVKDLKEHLQNILDELDCYKDEQEVKTVNNTYFLSSKTNFLACPQGFIDLTEIVECENDEDEDYDY